MSYEILNAIQEKAKEKYRESNYFSILEMCGGTGKTKTSIELTKGRTLVIIPLNSFIPNWEDELTRWNKGRYEFEFVNKSSCEKKIKELNSSNKRYNTLIIDEIHTLSERQMKAVKMMLPHFKQIIGLSATVSDKKRQLLRKTLGIKSSFIYPIDQAVKDGVVSDYEIDVVQIKMDNKEKFHEASSKKDKDKKTLISDKELYDRTSYIYDKFRKASFGAYGAQKAKLMKSMEIFALKRRRVIAYSISKIKFAKKIVNLMKGKRIIAFTAFADIADAICEHSFHSKNEKKNNLQKFKDCKIDQLAVVRMADVGLNIKPIRFALIHQVDSNFENLEQRLFRLLRLEYDNPNKRAKLIVLVAKGTRDTEWFSKATKNLDKRKINYYDEDEYDLQHI